MRLCCCCCVAAACLQHRHGSQHPLAGPPHSLLWFAPSLPAMQELGLRNAWVSETIFWCMFIPFILWSFSPFVTARKRFYTAVLYARLLMVLVSESTC